MSFEEFCVNNKAKQGTTLTMADLRGGRKYMSIREREVKRLRSIITEFEIEDDTFFEKISIPEDAFSRYSPDDESYLLGCSRRGVWVVCDGCDIYIVARGKMFEMSARQVCYKITRAADKIFGRYSVTGCWAM